MTRAGMIFVLGASHFFISQLYRTANAVIAPWLLKDLALDTEGLGLMSAAFFYAFALAQIPITLLLDRIGPKRMMIAFSFLGLAGGLLFSLAQGLGTGVAGRVLMGLGMACNLMGPLKLLTAWFSPLTFATLSGVLYSIGTFGNMFSSTPLVLLVERLGWRVSFQVVVGLHLVLTLALFWVIRDRPEEARMGPRPKAPAQAAGSAFGGLGRLLRRRDYWIISMGTFVRYGTHAALQALWAGPLLMGAMGYSPVEAGNILLAMNVGMILGGPLWGAAADRVFRTPKWPVAAGLMLLAGVTLVLRALPAGTSPLATGVIFFSFGLVSATGLLVYAHIKMLVPLEMAGAAMSGTNFFTMMGPAVFLQGLGTVMQTLYPGASLSPAAFQSALLVCAACQAAIGGLYLFTRRK
jgi:MFS family permease